MKNNLLLTYKVAGFPKISQRVASVEEAQFVFETSRDMFAGFASSELRSKVLVKDGKTVVAEINYNGTIA